MFQRSRLGWVFVGVMGLGMTAGSAWGQDPTKVEPKHYKLDFENDKVQVVSVHYGPHEKSQMHEHPGGVVVVVTGGHLKFTDENGKVTEVYAKAGEALVRAVQTYRGECRRHGLQRGVCRDEGWEECDLKHRGSGDAGGGCAGGSYWPLAAGFWPLASGFWLRMICGPLLWRPLLLRCFWLCEALYRKDVEVRGERLLDATVPG
jgi:hypothetical protein